MGHEFVMVQPNWPDRQILSVQDEFYSVWLLYYGGTVHVALQYSPAKTEENLEKRRFISQAGLVVSHREISS